MISKRSLAAPAFLIITSLLLAAACASGPKPVKTAAPPPKPAPPAAEPSVTVKPPAEIPAAEPPAAAS